VLTARTLRPDLYIVARSSHPDSAEKLRRAGADRVVSPYTLSGRRMAALAMQPAVVDTFDLLVGGADTSMRVEELVVGAVGGRGAPRPSCAAPGGAAGAALRRRRAAGGPGRRGDPPSDDIVVAMGTRDQLTALAATLGPGPARR